MQDFLTDQLRTDELLRMVGNLILRIILRAFGQVFHYLIQQCIYIAAKLGGNRYDFGELMQLIVFGNQRKQRFRLDFVNLVHYEDDRCFDILELLGNIAVTSAHAFRSVHQKQYSFHLMQCAHRRLVHIIAQLGLSFMDTGRVQEYNLRIIRGVYPVDFISGGLRLVRHDGDLLSDHLVHECRFAYVRSADNGDKP
ncbi:hypothetical protein D3C73_854900 [compost metagenome]